MTRYDMNKFKSGAVYVKLLDRPNRKSHTKYTIQLSTYADKNHLNDLLEMISDIEIYLDIDDHGVVSGVEIVTFYDNSDNEDYNEDSDNENNDNENTR